MKSRFQEEGARLSLTEKKCEEIRTDLLIQSKKMIEEREKLRSRKDYCRTARAIVSRGGERPKATPETFNRKTDSIKATMKKLDEISRSLQRE